jgi:hypothetical protein
MIMHLATRRPATSRGNRVSLQACAQSLANRGSSPSDREPLMLNNETKQRTKDPTKKRECHCELCSIYEPRPSLTALQ